jgi:hypothetical protein
VARFFFLANVLLGKSLSGQTSFWANIFLANICWADVVLGICLWANVVGANVVSPGPPTLSAFAKSLINSKKQQNRSPNGVDSHAEFAC